MFKGTNMVYRPTSVTVISWLLIIFGVSSLFCAAVFVLKPHSDAQKSVTESPLPIYAQRGMMVGGTVAHLVCGVFMLRGRNWARILFVTWSAIGLSVNFATNHYWFFTALGLSILAIEAFFLFRPAANIFFADNGQNIDPRSLPSNRRIVGIVFYILAGFLFMCMGMATLMPDPELGIRTFLLCFFLFPYCICLVIGRWLSAGNWKLDIGYVVVLGSLSSGASISMMIYTFSQPEFTKNMTPEKAARLHEMFTDYTFAATWFGAWVLLGVALIVLGLRAPQPRQHPPIFGR
jgi:hypothetical protein